MKPPVETGFDPDAQVERSLTLTRRLALGMSLLASVVLIAPVIVGWFGGIDLDGCSFEDGCRTGWNLLGIWIDSTILCIGVAVVLWLVHGVNYVQLKRWQR